MSAEDAPSARRRSWAAREGLPYPLGLSYVPAERAYNFALYSKHATSVRLVFFARDELSTPRLQLGFDPSEHKSGRVWHRRVPEEQLAGCDFYAYTVDGPDPHGAFAFHAFQAQKMLLDPYARRLHFPSSFSRSAAIAPGANMGKAALCTIERDLAPFAWGDEPRPHHEADAIIYELHVRDFTQHPSAGVAEEVRGTFAGVVAKIPYLRELGVTIVELMPVFQFDPQGPDHWGYMPVSFFSPHLSYAPAREDALAAFRSMVKALHEAEIEVVLDVVYNHTAEGGEDGPVYSYKGIDNSTYYLMHNGGTPGYADFSGTGNSLNCTNRYVRKMILDSMRYWVKEMHVDGFRFDLASVFTRNSDGSINFEEPPIFGDISSDPDFDRVRMIAEPWDATGASALGRSFPGITWLQWNSRFRDDVRRFVRGDGGMVPALIQRLRGSNDIFPDDLAHAYHAYQSVNYVTCHDGFTLYDLVSYERKHNEANGQNNRDGSDENFSTNSGHEGDLGAPREVLLLRERKAKSLLALLLLANGTPMLRAGDEFLHTQGGNNNPYNQDNETSWLDWRRREQNRDFFRFVRELIAFRKRHPSLGRSRAFRDDARWYGVQASSPAVSEARRFGLYLRGAAEADADLYLLVNGEPEAVSFQLQELSGQPWRRVLDTGRSAPNDLVSEREAPEVAGSSCEVSGRSVVLLLRGGDSLA